MKKHLHWVAIGVVALLAIVANIRVPKDLSAEVQWLDKEIIAQGDSIQALATGQDSLAIAVAMGDSTLRAELQGRTKVLADSATALRASLTKLQKSAASASRVRKLEGEIKQSLDLSKLTRDQLDLLQRAFGDHVTLRASDAHGDKKLAAMSTQKTVNRPSGWWWKRKNN